ncbi:hypothetical protein QVD17_37376 [Tagetes erecta]|uniref:Uncharacterized protein n=1 Tax=Tagetes erecta TaxID=13708 RepID=A0AAD8NCN6_TARER|nr:hypothetical protein QVD17_37376 [Tagetes erecta]
MSIDLGNSPFLFSKRQNKFVFQGCGVAVMMDNGNVVTWCSTACLNVTLKDANMCVGNGCCQTTNPQFVKSYNINLENQGEDGACGLAFLVDIESYKDETLLDPYFLKNASFIPVSLLWTLTDLDHVTCCDKRDLGRRKVDVFNNTPVDTWKCDYSGLADNPYLIDGCRDDAIPKYAQPGCNDMCGNVRIPYPFGIGVDCSFHQWYTVDCNFSTPYLPALNNLEVLGVSLENQTIILNTPRFSDCQNIIRDSYEIMSVDIGRSPFFFGNNKFVFEGCGIAALMDNESVVTACSTSCRSVTPRNRNNYCETAFAYSLKSYRISITGLKEEDGACESAFLVDQNSYDEGRFTNQFIARNTSFIPISLMWTLPDSNQITCCYNNARGFRTLDMFNGTRFGSLTCYKYSSIEGNPYLIDGCKSNPDNYNHDNTEECQRCIDSGGYCTSTDRVYDVDNSVFSEKFGCYRDKKVSLGVILGMLCVSISMGTRDDLLTLANLATRCLNLNGKYRPTMKEVAIELETIRTSRIPSNDQTIIKPVMYGEEFSMPTYDESSSTFVSFNGSIS